jgi:hypothetical protein
MARETIRDLLSRVTLEGGPELLNSFKKLASKVRRAADAYPPVELEEALAAAKARIPLEILSIADLSQGEQRLTDLATQLAESRNLDASFAREVVEIWKDVLAPVHAEWREALRYAWDPHTKDTGKLLEREDPEHVIQVLVARGLPEESASRVVSRAAGPAAARLILCGLFFLAMSVTALAIGVSQVHAFVTLVFAVVITGRGFCRLGV